MEVNESGQRNGDLDWPGAGPNGQVDRIHYDGTRFVLGGGFIELWPDARVGLGRICRGLGLIDEAFDPGQSIHFVGAPVIRVLASTQDPIYVGGFFNVSSQQELPGFLGWDHRERVGGSTATTATWYRFKVIRPFP